MKKLAIITTHPIQYNAPVFKMLTARKKIDIKVFYTWGESVLKDKFDPGFGKVIDWDIPLLQGYDFTMVDNISADPGSHHYKGIINPSLHQNIKEWGADAVLIFGWNFSSHLSCMRYFHGKIPVFFRGDSTNLDRGLNIFKNLIRQKYLQFIYRKVDKFLFVGKANKKYYELVKVDAEKLVFTPHAVDNSRFSAPTSKSFRQKFNLSTGSVLFLYAGKFEAKKNVDLLIDAFAKCNSGQGHLLLVGNGPLETALKTKVSGLSTTLKERIHFMDFQNQSAMPELYQSCDVFVLPSKGPGETWGLAINEAMASSKAVIVSDKCGAAEDLVDEGRNGFVFESGNADALTQKMNYFLSHPHKIQDFGMHSGSIIGDWSFEKICEAIERVVNEPYKID